MTTTQIDPPGFAEDLLPENRRKWSEWMSTTIDAAVAGRPEINDGPRRQFFNPLTSPPGDQAQERDITWQAFPRIVRIKAPTDTARWKRADSSRDLQDEYCEWSVERDAATGRIRSVTFTSEGPEYWQALAQWQPDTLLALYQEHISPAVTAADLFGPDGRYIARNRWNTSTSGGAMHLTQEANTLSAEVELAGAATIVRSRDGRVLTSAQELIDCSQYGDPQRNSDPHIGEVVNELARLGADLTLANPMGLSISGLATTGWTTPDGSDAADYWTITRGAPNKALRAVYQVPADQGFVVGDIQINGRPIEYGGQIADFITIKLTGLATRIDASKVRPLSGCLGPARAVAVGGSDPDRDAGGAVPPVPGLLLSGGLPSRRAGRGPR